MNRRRVACYAGPRRLDPVYLPDADRTFRRATSSSQCIDEVTPDEPSFLSRVWDNPMNDVCACARLEGMRCSGRSSPGRSERRRGNNGNAHRSLGIGWVRPHPRESLQTGSFSERAPPGANLRALIAPRRSPVRVRLAPLKKLLLIARSCNGGRLRGTPASGLLVRRAARTPRRNTTAGDLSRS
jgi:hypothetical protein